MKGSLVVAETPVRASAPYLRDQETEKNSERARLNIDHLRTLRSKNLMETGHTLESLRACFTFRSNQTLCGRPLVQRSSIA